MTMNIKKQKKWKYNIDVCVDYRLTSEDGADMIHCKGYIRDQENMKRMSFDICSCYDLNIYGMIQYEPIF